MYLKELNFVLFNGESTVLLVFNSLIWHYKLYYSSCSCITFI